MLLDLLFGYVVFALENLSEVVVAWAGSIH
jgi:hypothetical protein